MAVRIGYVLSIKGAAMVTTFELPYFASHALMLLPDFLEAIGEEVFRVQHINYTPDLKALRQYPDPMNGMITFSGRGGSITFCFRYRSGEEGTRGSVDELTSILVVRVGRDPSTFFYTPHYCRCHHCKGVRYPFRPPNIEESAFERMTEMERRHAIKDHADKKFPAMIA